MNTALRPFLLASAVAWLAIGHATGLAAISTSGDVAPPYPVGMPDPWNVGADLLVGNSANGSLTIDGGSEVISTGGMAGNNASVVGSIVVSGGGSTWDNSGDLTLGSSGSGTLNVLEGAQVTNTTASLGHIVGAGTALVEGEGSIWSTADMHIIGNGGNGQLTIREQGSVLSGIGRIGRSAGATGVVVVDGQGSSWEIFDSLTLGDTTNGGSATLSLTGAGSRVYVGTAAIMLTDQLPAQQTALIVSERIGISRLSIYGGNQLNNSGDGYIALGTDHSGKVTIDGSTSAWNNDGNVSIGAGGPGTLSLVDGGTASAAGTMSVHSFGRIEGNGNLTGNTQNSGTIAPGLSAGRLSLAGGYSQLASGRLEVELAGSSAGQFDDLLVSGAATLDGTLEVSLLDSYVPQVGNSFEILNASGVSGRFADAVLPTLPTGRMWQLRYLAGEVRLAVTLAGDYNDNGVVDAADYVMWRNLLGTELDPRADGDTNGVVNAADYAIWRSNFGITAGTGSAAGLAPYAAEIPEPATAALLSAVLGIVPLFARRRNDSRLWRTLAHRRYPGGPIRLN